MVKRLLTAFTCVVALMASAPAQAAPILVPTTDTVLGTFAVDFVAGTTTVAIAGAAAADILNPGVVLSGVIDADSPAAPATDDALFFDLADEGLLFDFDLGSSVGLGTAVWTLLVGGTGLTAITDPALVPFLVTNNTGLFALLGEPVITTDDTGAPLTALFTYSLESIVAPTQVEPIPEPATLGLVGMGILAAARARKARRKNDVA